ncbi:hypothetical protein M7I_1411 [Glarea lozoyensis 74030]|uniref:Uncharacterized protein n=1 Tax=Glarea lozoyensis (strain ATCC 74030 / MF5533) TaxID=1104152 RepID=H0EG03_GLAL7|nr:hypothetical protein M7I_1411 [Glarea lozoyensis 74030]
MIFNFQNCPWIAEAAPSPRKSYEKKVERKQIPDLCLSILTTLTSTPQTYPVKPLHA